MAAPTIERRLQKRFVLMTVDVAFESQVRQIAGDDWAVSRIVDLDDLGDWNDLLLYRFLLLDLDEVDTFDPIDVIRQIRMSYQINTPVFCFGGEEDIQDEMRLSRADRFFSRDELLAMLPQFCQQYDW